MVDFEDGTLISGAYVEIDGTRYPVHMPEYKGKTPLTSENLNKAQKDLNNDIIELQKKITGKILYSDDYGTVKENILLSDSVRNYDYIEIFCKRDSFDYGSTRVFNPNGKTVTLSANYSSGTEIYVYAKVIKIDENKINVINSNLAYFDANSQNFAVDNSNFITKVIGYKISENEEGISYG